MVDLHNLWMWLILCSMFNYIICWLFRWTFQLKGWGNWWLGIGLTILSAIGTLAILTAGWTDLGWQIKTTSVRTPVVIFITKLWREKFKKPIWL